MNLQAHPTWGVDRGPISPLPTEKRSESSNRQAIGNKGTLLVITIITTLGNLTHVAGALGNDTGGPAGRRGGRRQ